MNIVGVKRRTKGETHTRREKYRAKERERKREFPRFP